MSEIDPFIRRLTPSFRVGITGARRLAPEAVATLQEQLTAVLDHIKTQLTVLSSAPDGPPLYAPGPVDLRFISPLAEGADRLAARAALTSGYRLEVPLPFAKHDYENDFPGSIDEFRDLLAEAGPHVLEMGGARGEEENRSYEAVGRLVVRNCDLLIAIWDGGKGNGRGGTAGIVHYAARHGLPIWWLRANGDGEPVWIERLQDTVRAGHSHSGLNAWRKLDASLRSAMVPPVSPGSDPLAVFAAETPPSDKFIWNIYQRVMYFAAGRPKASPYMPKLTLPDNHVWSFWQTLYRPIDNLAVAYGNRYRSSYILVFTLAAFAIGFAVVGVGYQLEALIATIGELACLIGIFAIVRTNSLRNWHSRLINYRLLAELCRKQQALAMFGWSLKLITVKKNSEDAESEPTTLQKDAWVGWYFNAALRSAPLPRGQLTGETLKTAFDAVESNLITGQANYHARRRHDSEAAAHRFGQLGRGFFIATILIVITKLILLLREDLWPVTINGGQAVFATDLLRLFQGILPGISAAFVGIRGYAELELLADQSAQMQLLMTHAESVLQHLDLSEPLASEDVGAQLLLLAETMMHDIKGWAQLFRVKAVDTG